ncbi:hypothetical protein C8F01DRAFT_1161682 [Mycena amicta]|nr:hypothetical protein C8F01DRAFT_1161682 [Mycena amicta]
MPRHTQSWHNAVCILVFLLVSTGIGRTIREHRKEKAHLRPESLPPSPPCVTPQSRQTSGSTAHEAVEHESIFGLSTRRIRPAFGVPH